MAIGSAPTATSIYRIHRSRGSFTFKSDFQTFVKGSILLTQVSRKYCHNPSWFLPWVADQILIATRMICSCISTMVILLPSAFITVAISRPIIRHQLSTVFSEYLQDWGHRLSPLTVDHHWEMPDFYRLRPTAIMACSNSISWVSTCTWRVGNKRPVPLITVTLRCFANAAKPELSWELILFFQSSNCSRLILVQQN